MSIFNFKSSYVFLSAITGFIFILTSTAQGETPSSNVGEYEEAKSDPQVLTDLERSLSSTVSVFGRFFGTSSASKDLATSSAQEEVKTDGFEQIPNQAPSSQSTPSASNEAVVLDPITINGDQQSSLEDSKTETPAKDQDKVPWSSVVEQLRAKALVKENPTCQANKIYLPTAHLNSSSSKKDRKLDYALVPAEFKGQVGFFIVHNKAGKDVFKWQQVPSSSVNSERPFRVSGHDLRVSLKRVNGELLLEHSFDFGYGVARFRPGKTSGQLFPREVKESEIEESNRIVQDYLSKSCLEGTALVQNLRNPNSERTFSTWAPIKGVNASSGAW